MILEQAARHPVATVLAWSVVLALAVAGVHRLNFEIATESVLDVTAPEWEQYVASTRMFGGDEVVVVAFPSEDDRSVSIAGIADKMAGVRRVDSLLTLPLVRSGTGLDLDLRSPWEIATAAGTGLLGAIDLAKADPVGRGLIVSDDGAVVAVNVILEGRDPQVQAQIVEALRAAAPRAWISGVPVFKVEASARTKSELSVFVPVTICLVGMALWFMCGLRPTVALLVAGSVGSAVGLGTMGFAGVPLTISTMILPSILFVLGTAYSLHVVHACCAVGEPVTVKGAVGQVAAPVLLSGLTTALGFGALGLVQIPLVRELGIFGAIGIGAQVFATLLLLPSLLVLLDARISARGNALFLRAGAATAHLASGRKTLVVVSWVAVASLCAAGIPGLRIETNAVEWFPYESEVRDSYERIRSSLSGISPLNIVLDSHGGAAVSEPRTIALIEGLASHLEALPDVGKALSIATPLRMLHAQVSPDSAELTAPMIEQYMLLLESIPYTSDLVTPDLAAANVLLRADDNGSRSLMEVAGEATRWWDQNGDPRFQATATGVMYEFARAEEAIAWGQIRGLGAGIVAVGIVLLSVLRSPLVAAAALAPNAIPLVIVFGLLGFLGVPLDAVTIGIGCLVLGIAVDDTLHVSIWYRRATEQGMGANDAIREALGRALKPMTLTTIAVGFGFAALLLSEFAVTQSLGGVTAFMMLVCLAADVTMLPVLLVLSRRERA